MKKRHLGIILLLLTTSFVCSNLLYSASSLDPAGKSDEIKLNGCACQQYKLGNNKINPSSGEFSFDVRFDFDPTAKTQQNNTILRNQIFITFQTADGASATLYSCLSNICFLVNNSKGDRIALTGNAYPFEGNKWYNVKLTWGDRLRIYINGNRIVDEEINGLMAQLPPDDINVFIGCQNAKNRGLEDRFSVKNLKLSVPDSEKPACLPVTTFPLINDDKPVFDGKLDESFWKKAGKVTGFVGFSNFELVAEQPCVLAAYCKDGIYIGMETPIKNGCANAILKEHNSAISYEDSFEIRLQPDAEKYYTFICSAIGTKYDSVSTVADGKQFLRADPGWEVKTFSGSGKWSAEIFIPYRALGCDAPPAAGCAWRGNYCINSSSGYAGSATWAFTGGNFCNSRLFGVFIFSGEQRTLRFEEIKGYLQGRPECYFRLCGLPSPVITLKGKCFDSIGKLVSEYAFPLSDGANGIYRTDFLNPGIHKMILSGVDSEKKEWLRQEFYFTPKINVAIDLENYPYAGFAEVGIAAGKYASSARKANVWLEDKNGAVVSAKKEAVFRNGKAHCNVETEKLEAGNYMVCAELIDAKGTILDKAVNNLEIFSKPSWWMNNFGIDHTVPPPWTPVKESSSGGLHVWGREYILNGGLFPLQIVNQKRKIFPDRPSLNLNGKNLLDIKCSRKEKFDDEIILSGSGVVNGFKTDCQGKLEFDGFFKYDFSITPERAKTIDSLILEIPIEKELAQYIQVSTGSQSNVSKLKGNIAMGFAPSLWLGNYDMGLAVVFETNRYWTPSNNKKTIEVIHDGNKVKLRYNIITSPFEIKDKISFSLALHPTPVKALKSHDPFRLTRWRTVSNWKNVCSYMIERPENLVYSNLKWINGKEGTIELWVKRNPEANKKNSEFFHVENEKGNINAFIDNAGRIAVLLNGINILKTEPVKFDSDFVHFSLSWMKNNITIHLNGKNILSRNLGASAGKWSSIIEDPQSLFVIGCRDLGGAKGTCECDITVDELRISSKLRYSDNFAVPVSPFEKDAATVLLDHFDESFRPDGYNAETQSGGIPSLGTVFVPAKFKNGLRLVTEIPENEREIRKNLGNEFEMFGEMGWNRDGIFPPDPFNPLIAGASDAIAAAHKDGWRAVPYFVFPALQMGTKVQKQFSAEWCLKPVNIVPMTPTQYAIYVSPAAKGYADYLAAGVKYIMEKLGFDGIYTDGFTRVSQTANLRYAGYTDDDGKIVGTWPLFGCREAMKRLYKIVKSINPNGFIVNHSSDDTEIIILSFSDMYYTAEHEDYENLDTVKIRFRGEPWGLESRLYSDNPAKPLHKMIAMLHGTDIWGYTLIGLNDMCRKFINIRNAYEKANFRTAEWIPYFKGESVYYKDSDSNVKVSMYLHKGKDAFLIIGNLAKETKTVSIPLILKALGFDSKSLEAQNALTGVQANISPDGVLETKVKGKSFTLINLTAK